jgi:FAD-linked sulfhydryl oxidase
MRASKIVMRVLQASSLLPLAVAAPSFCHKAPQPDPFDCSVPACADMSAMFKKSVQGLDKKRSNIGNQNGSAAAPTVLPAQYNGCPVDKNALGASTWNLMHTMAANYPEQPTVEQQSQMTALIEGLSMFYPCAFCAADFRQSIKDSPPR